MGFESTFPLAGVCYSGPGRRRKAERANAALQDEWEPGKSSERTVVHRESETGIE